MTMTPPAARSRSVARASVGTVLALFVGSVVVACSGGPSASGSASPSSSLGIGGSSGAEPFRTPTPTPKPSPGSTSDEGMLKELLPKGGSDAKCVSAADAEERAASARVKCTYKALGQTVWLTAYESAQELADAYTAQQAGSKSGKDGCQAARFHGTYALGGEIRGELACLRKSGDAWMVWTIEDRYVLGEATRKGNTSKPLYQWWAKAKPFGVKGALKLSTTTPPPAESPSPSA